MFKAMGFDDFAKELDSIGKVDEYAPELLKTAAPILEEELRRQVKKEANREYATGDLERAIKANKPGVNQYGHYVSVTAKGKDKKGTRNNEKLAYLNYGTVKQEARPVIPKALKNAEDGCMDAMQKKFNEVVK